MVPFAGYRLPLNYPAGIIAEHLQVRDSAGFFDVSHMGQVEFRGPDSAKLLARLCPIDAAGMIVGSSKYSFFLNDDAGILDDAVVMRLSEDGYLIICNAARKEADLARMCSNSNDLDIEIVVPGRAMIAVQGPRAEEVLSSKVPEAGTLRFMTASRLDGDRVISRTGYSGEDGFELALPRSEAANFVNSILANPLLKPIGLGARDTLRLEAGLCLYGQDLTEETNPVEAGLMWTVPRRILESGEFIGAEALRATSKEEPGRIRVGMRPAGRVPVRPGALLYGPNDKVIGHVTSGGFAPSLRAPVAMGYVSHAYGEPGTTIDAEVRGKRIACHVTGMPFVRHRYNKGTAR